MKTTFAAERLMDAPADTIYHCLADYREHHRPDGFLPPAFSDLEILRGGVGDGTEYRLAMDVGGRRRDMVVSVRETVPGRELVETGSGLQTTFTVDPTDTGVRVRFETVMDLAGLPGLLFRLFADRWLRPIYEEELRRLETHAQAHAPSMA